MSNDLQAALLVGILAIGVAGLMWRVLTGFWRDYCPRISIVGKAATVVLILVLAGIGADKSPMRKRIATLVTSLRGGELLDPSGRVGTAAAMAAVEEINLTAGEIITSASNTVADSQYLFDEAAQILTNRDLRVAYIAADLPRALPGVHTNSNVAANIQRTRQDGTTNLLAWVWFSEEPSIVPQVSLSCSIAENVYEYLPAITNSFPETVDVDGVPCVEYRYEIPASARGIVFKPEYELAFGGAEREPLIVPPGGILMQTNDVSILPFTGVDHYSDTLSVTYKGGIAVAARWHGTNYTGRVRL